MDYKIEGSEEWDASEALVSRLMEAQKDPIYKIVGEIASEKLLAIGKSLHMASDQAELARLCHESHFWSNAPELLSRCAEHIRATAPNKPKEASYKARKIAEVAERTRALESL